MRTQLLASWEARQHGQQHQQQQQQAQAQEPGLAIPPDFRFNKVVAIIAFDRFRYFRHVITALLQAWGSEEYSVTIWIDGAPEQEDRFHRQGWESIIALSKQLQWLSRNASTGFRDVHVNVSSVNLGVWANKKRGVAGAMALSDFAVVLEDDIVVAPDALRWFEWHVTSGLIFEREDIAVATCWSVSFPLSGGAVEARDVLSVRQLGLLDKYWVDAWAQPWGWALWRRTWDALGADWSGRDFHLGQAVKGAGWHETMPLVARCNNIGSVGHNKKGMLTGHVHQRSITSALFPGLDACRYAELERANTSSLIDREELYEHAVRRGITADAKFQGATMEEQLAAGEKHMAEHPVASGWKSTC
jgi:hypothetical protein